jgi:hypothetical protein
MNRSCRNCSYFFALENQCRRELRSALMSAPGQQGPVVGAGFPIVRPDWWCGDFKPVVEEVKQ